MPGASAEVGDILRAMAAVLTVVRGRLAEVCASLPEEEPALDPAPDEEESVPSLRSLVGCIVTDTIDPAIRDLLRAAEQDSPAPLAAADELDEAQGPTMSLPMSRLARELQRQIAEHERSAREAEDLYMALMAVEAAKRAASLKDPRFHRATLAEKLLEESRNALPDAPGKAEELAGLAAAVAGYFADADEAADTRVRAACRLADARRLAGDPAGAEQALGDATLLSGDAGAQAELCRALALLRWEGGRTEEAAALLDRAAALWAEEEVTYEESACRVLRALLLVDEGGAKDAVVPLRENLTLLTDPWLTLFGGLALALGLAERGLLQKARTRRDEAAALVHRTPPAVHLYGLRLKGVIAASLGELTPSRDELAAAEAHFDELRFAALEGRWLAEAAVATLAQAQLDLARGMGREPARERVAALAATFSGTEGLDAVLETLREYPDQLPAGESLRSFTAALMANLLRLLRLGGARSAPLPFT
jgi:hypothetical protein